MDAQQLDVIVRVAGVTLLTALAAMLASARITRRTAGYFAPLAVGLGGFLIGNTPDEGLRLSGVLAGAAHLASGYAAVFLWWFSLASFDREFRPRGAVLAVGLAWFAIASGDRGLFGPAFAGKGLSWLLVAIGFGMVGHLAWRLLRDREGDLVEGRRQARLLVPLLLAALLFSDLVVDVIFGLDWRPRWFAITQNGAVLAFTALLMVRLFRATSAQTADLPAFVPPPRPPIPEGEARLAERLRRLIEVDQVHLEPDLTFADFVGRMGASERTVRQFINQRLGHDHFRSFLNAHRMAEARRALADPARAGDKLIAIAMDSGFASLASFNRVFLASEGCSPSAYREARASEAPAFEQRSAAF